MNILKILGIVAGIHVVAFFLMFVNPGCRSTSSTQSPVTGDTAPALTPQAPIPADTGSGAAAAVSVNISSPPPVRYSPTRPGTPASEALENTPLTDVTPATTYTVVRGDSLSRIAKKNHSTIAELMKANHLTNSAVLNVGQKLIVPGKAPATAPMAGGSAEVAVTGASYTVKPGDTLADIAHRAGSTTAELKRLNSLKSDYVQVGRELKLPAGSAPAAMEAKRNPPMAPPAGPASVKTPEGAQTYEVKPGETLGAIAHKFHVKTQDLLVANNIADPRKIRPGQNLVIPAGGASAATGAVVKPSVAAPAAPAPATANATTSVAVPPPATPPVLDAGAKAPGEVPVIKVDDSSDTKTP
jgi:LysM repeat protein